MSRCTRDRRAHAVRDHMHRAAFSCHNAKLPARSDVLVTTRSERRRPAIPHGQSDRARHSSDYCGNFGLNAISEHHLR